MINDYFYSHENKPILILGCGPSMTNEVAADLMKMDIPTIGVNKCYMFDDMRFRPKYHVSAEAHTDFILMNQDVLHDMARKGTKLVMPSSIDKNLKKTFQPQLHFKLESGKNRYKFYKYRSQKSQVAFAQGNTAIFVALQFAAYLGASPIYLLGVDFKLTKDNRLHNYDTVSLPEQTAKRWDDKAFAGKIRHLNEVAEEIAKYKIPIFNLSQDSKLDCFPKLDMSLNELASEFNREYH